MFWNLFHIWKKQIKSFFAMKLYDNIGFYGSSSINYYLENLFKSYEKRISEIK